MGYRSNVDVVFYTRDNEFIPEGERMPFAALKLWVDENYPVKEAIDGWDATVTYEPERGYIYISYLDVKWYPVGHVHDVDAALATFDETFDGANNVAYEFVRIGEQPEDIEELRSDEADYRLGVRREVYFD